MKIRSFALLALSCAALISADHPAGYVTVESGGSFSLKTKIKANESFWDPSPQGYNSDLNRTPFFGLGLGYYLCDWISLGGSFTMRNAYQYKKKQTSTATGQPNFLGDKNRRFRLDNTAFMANVFINQTGAFSRFRWCMGCMSLAPYIGAGVGFSNNTVSDFHSVTAREVTVGGVQQNVVGSIMTSKSIVDFSWQVTGGLSWAFSDCGYFNFGYRFFDGGKIRSNNFIVDTFDNGTDATPITVPAWKGKLRAHEFVVGLALSV